MIRPGSRAVRHALVALLGFAFSALHAVAAPSAPGVSASPPRPAVESRPTLWHALRPDGTEAFYLLGSVHLGRPSTLRFSDAMTRIFERSHELVLEVSPEELAVEAATAATLRFARIPPPGTLRDRLSSDALAALARYLELRGESLEPYLRIEAWFVSFQIDVREAERAGLSAEYGVDRHFAMRALGRMPVIGLETTELQARMLSELPADVQELMLIEKLLRTDRAGEGIANLVDAWERGDDRAVERIVYGPLYETPKLAVFYERFVVGRNEAMTKGLASLARDGQLRFVVIGAGHMVGARGIPALLRDYGFRVEKIEVD